MYPTLILTHYQCRAAAIEFLLHSPALWMEALPGTVRETHIIIIIIVCLLHEDHNITSITGNNLYTHV